MKNLHESLNRPQTIKNPWSSTENDRTWTYAAALLSDVYVNFRGYTMCSALNLFSAVPLSRDHTRTRRLTGWKNSNQAPPLPAGLLTVHNYWSTGGNEQWWRMKSPSSICSMLIVSKSEAVRKQVEGRIQVGVVWSFEVGLESYILCV